MGLQILLLLVIICLYTEVANTQTNSGNCTFNSKGKEQALHSIPNGYQYYYWKYNSPTINCVLIQDDDIIEVDLPEDLKTGFNNSLQILNVTLRGSNLPILKSTLFYNIKVINMLNCEKCNIEEIAGNAFDKITYINEINLGQNKIKSFKQQLFVKLINLTKLELNDNVLSSFEVILRGTEVIDVSFNDIAYINITCDQLISLNLSHNKIEDLHRSNFGGIQNLNHLYLSHNNISSIAGGVFHNLANLLYIDLSVNNINAINLSSFLGLQNLKQLFLDYNRISNVDTHAFHDLQSLNELSLSGNLITILDPNLVAKSTLPNLKYISLNNNPWDCQNLVRIIQLSKNRETAVVINKGDDRSNSSIIGIKCKNTNALKVKIESTDNKVVPANNNNEFRSAFDSDKLSNIITKLDIILKQLDVDKSNTNVLMSNFSNFFNEGFQNSDFARFFTSSFRNLPFFKYFEREMINFTVSSILNQAESIDPNNSSIDAIVDILSNFTKQFNSVYENDATNNNLISAEKMISQDASAVNNNRSENLIIGLICFLTIIVISMLFMAFTYFYNKNSFHLREKLVNFRRGDSESKVTIEELECM